MSHSIIMPIDYAALPAAMLDAVKAHCRVRHADDDALLLAYTGQAISFVEKVWGLQVFTMGVAWIPEPAGKLARYQLPVWPASAFTVTSEGVDVSTAYRLEMTSMTEPWWAAKKDGLPFPADAAVTLTTGHADAGTMDPAMSSAILRVTAMLYENCETVGATVGFVPSWINDLLVGLWVPRA